MRSRVHNLTKWQRVAEGDGLHYAGAKPRTVVLEVNSPDEVRYFVRQDPEQLENSAERVADKAANRSRIEGDESADESGLAFLGVCKGRGTLEFGVDGPFDLIVEGGDAYVYSADGLQVETVVIEPLIFTRIANRKQRNPHLEMVEYQMRLNQQRFKEALEAEMSRREQALERRLESYAAQRDQRAPDALVGRSPGPDGVPGGSAAGAAGEGRANEEEGRQRQVPLEGREDPSSPPKSRRKAAETAGS